MSIPRDFPSYRLRHRLRVWREHRRYPWHHPYQVVAGATAADEADTAADEADTAADEADTAADEADTDTDGREGLGSRLPGEVDLTKGTFEPWRSRSWAARHWASRPRIPHPRAILLLLVCALAFLVTLSMILTLRATGDLRRGRSALVQARDEVARGAFAQAAATFETARFEFDAAKVTMDNPFVSVAAMVPLIGRTPDAIRSGAEAGILVTEAGKGLSSAVGHLRGGVEALSLSGDRIPVRALVRFQPAVADALSAVVKAERLADGVATTFVPGEIADAGDQLRSALHQSVSALTSTNAILRALPVFAGMERPQRYFLAPEDPAELRGTGGSIGYWAILRIGRGRISLQTFHYIDELPDPDQPAWPSDALEAAYGSVNAAGDWNFANAPADGPTAAGFISRLWEGTGNKPIDGVIMIDVHALGSMLEATGPVQVEGVPLALTSSNVVSFLSNGAYLMPGGPDLSRDRVGLAALTIFEDFLAEARGYAALRALFDATAAGHILMNATDPTLQSEFQIAGVTGAIAPAPGDDLFALTINNLAGNRVDYYVRRTMDYDVTLLPDGRGRATATLTFENDSPRDPPTSALSDVLRPRAGPADLELGETFEQATITCGRGCRLTGSSIDGADLAMTMHPVGGLRTFTGILRTPPEGSSTLTMTFDLENVWSGDGAQGTYALSIPTQPVILGTDGTVTIHAPSGMTFAAVSPGMRTGGASTTWHGSMSDVLTLRTRFQRDALGRIWWGLKSVF